MPQIEVATWREDSAAGTAPIEVGVSNNDGQHTARRVELRVGRDLDNLVVLASPSKIAPGKSITARTEPFKHVQPTDGLSFGDRAKQQEVLVGTVEFGDEYEIFRWQQTFTIIETVGVGAGPVTYHHYDPSPLEAPERIVEHEEACSWPARVGAACRAGWREYKRH